MKRVDKLQLYTAFLEMECGERRPGKNGPERQKGCRGEKNTTACLT